MHNQYNRHLTCEFNILRHIFPSKNRVQSVITEAIFQFQIHFKPLIFFLFVFYHLLAESSGDRRCRRLLLLCCTCSMLCIHGIQLKWNCTHIGAQCANCTLICFKSSINSSIEMCVNMGKWQCYMWIDPQMLWWLHFIGPDVDGFYRKMGKKKHTTSPLKSTQQATKFVSSNTRFPWYAQAYLARICQEIVTQVVLHNNTQWNERLGVIECVCIKKSHQLNEPFPIQMKMKHR